MELKFVVDEDYDIKFSKHQDLVKYMKSIHKSSKEYLEKSKKLYQKSWDEMNNKFSSFVKKLTGYDWFYEEYTCVVSAYFGGHTNWGTAPRIARVWKENPDHMKPITAHELFMSHYFEIIKRHYKKENLTDGQIWALAEITAWELRNEKFLVKNFWPFWIVDEIKYFGHENIRFLMTKLHKKYVKRKNFDDYIRYGIKLIKKYPKIAPQVFVKE